MEKKIRPDPLIPDHEVLRKVGGGSYGEVWLARGVTGAMRAVKLVYREDFSDERTFEREFEGILKFEPLSRDHAGLVHVLHVGRSDGASPFYYYVMELGDDAYSDEFNPVEYEPRTLRTDMKLANGTPLDTDFCIETGRLLADALSRLHAQGLTHRDVKPSNVIFVDGKPKLADIGLVATTDQRTFVGTEGFVPPEGPGSEGADLYSLGKVLYEMATGMDRLDFPELPDEGPPEKSRKKWIRLNQLICDVCEPRIEKRTIKTAAQFAQALHLLQKGKRAPRQISPMAGVFSALVMILVLAVGQTWLEYTWGRTVIEGNREPLPIRYVSVRVQSVDNEQTVLSGVDVYDPNGTWLESTPHRLQNIAVGDQLKLILKRKGYRDAVVEKTVVDDGTGSMLIEVELTRFAPPIEGERWNDALGMEYLPRGEDHLSVTHITESLWSVFAESQQVKDQAIVFDSTEAGVPIRLVAVSNESAQNYAAWLTGKCLEEGFLALYSDIELEENREIRSRYDRSYAENKLPPDAVEKGWRPFRCFVQVIPYATLSFDSTPKGASIYIEGEWIGETQLTDFVILPGLVNYTIELEGYQAESGRLVLNDRAHQSIVVELKEDKRGVVFGAGARDWNNSLGMRFAPLGEDLMVSVWETRLGDYEAFLKAKGRTMPGAFRAESVNHPAVGMTRAEAREFCDWLTEVERATENIQTQHRYRLLTDLEWSEMAGLEETMAQPIQRDNDQANGGIYSWGVDIWPPPEKTGNFADQSAASNEGIGMANVINDYVDGMPKASPVGSFPPNEKGFYDVAGNVKEWVNDNYKEGDDGALYGVLRGADWKGYDKQHLELRFRDFVAPANRGETYGFRVVLAKEEEQDQKETAINANGNGGDTD
ncbi:MAG: SUMF1/EgtB/PvdO family nonheme iron enzyme [Verrucomicrobiaceae bacterium]